jgi:hypothetical protein
MLETLETLNPFNNIGYQGDIMMLSKLKDDKGQLRWILNN